MIFARWALPVVLVASTLGGGCGGGGSGGGSYDIASGALSGEIGGQTWSLVSGETDAFLSMNQPDFFTSLYMETVAPCTGAGFSVPSNFIIMNIPMAPGDYPLSLSLNATFVVDPKGQDQNLVATRGRILVDQVTATSVSGGAHIEYDGNNSVSGQFQATVCAQ